MKKFLHISIYLCISFLCAGKALGQTGDLIAGNYVVLYSGKVFKCTYIEYQSPIISADSLRFDEDDVKLFKFGYSIYANSKRFSLFNKTSNLLLAESTGKINLYQEITIITRTTQYGTSQTRSITYYYNKGFGDLKYTKIKFLKEDMADCAECIEKLDQIGVILNSEKKEAAIR
ncbi:MAG: hypothetical protein ACKVQB_03270, partial [Bacteroidia bacterium]